MSGRTPCLIVLLCGLVAPLRVVSAQELPVTVLDIRGDWQSDARPSAMLKIGDKVPVGSRIRAKSNQERDTITIVHDADLKRQTVVCDSSKYNPCLTPLAIEAGTAAPGTDGFLTTLMNATLALLRDKPPALESHYALTLTRGGPEVMREFEDVVSRDSATGLLLTLPTADMEAGTYTVSIKPAGSAGKTKDQRALLRSDGTWKPLALPQPGLYEIFVRSEAGGTLADEMVLIVAPADYPASRERFDAVKKKTADWTGPGARPDEHLLLRAFLLASSRAS